jgi:hypothetical protein
MRALAVCTLLLAAGAHAQDAVVVSVNADHLRGGNGGGTSALWVAPRAAGTLVAGATFLSLPGTHWAFATLGGTHPVSARTTLNAEANFGGGSDDRGGFGYLLLRAGVTRELLAKKVYAEAEWLQIDVARQQEGLARLGATWLPAPGLALRASLYRSLTGDGGTTLVTARADYALPRVSLLGGVSGGTANPALLQQSGTPSTRIREVFGGVAFGGERRWTIVANAISAGGERRQRLTVSCRLPLSKRVRHDASAALRQRSSPPPEEPGPLTHAPRICCSLSP